MPDPLKGPPNAVALEGRQDASPTEGFTRLFSPDQTQWQAPDPALGMRICLRCHERSRWPPASRSERVHVADGPIEWRIRLGGLPSDYRRMPLAA